MGFDKSPRMAKPPKHEDTPQRTAEQFEHEAITDNRLVWEVLEETDG